MTKANLYHVAHICGCGQFISHSQGDFDAHKFHPGTMINLYPLREKMNDAIKQGQELERRYSEWDSNDLINRGLMWGYGYGFFIGNMGNYVTMHEKKRMNVLYDIYHQKDIRSYRKQRAQEVFESYTWNVRKTLENLKAY